MEQQYETIQVNLACSKLNHHWPVFSEKNGIGLVIWMFATAGPPSKPGRGGAVADVWSDSLAWKSRK